MIKVKSKPQKKRLEIVSEIDDSDREQNNSVSVVSSKSSESEYLNRKLIIKSESSIFSIKIASVNSSDKVKW